MQMGPFRGIRMKKTAPRGFKDDSDTRHVESRMTMTRASWSDTGTDGSFLGKKDEKDRATWMDVSTHV